MKKYFNNSTKGFTLVEVMVATSIFVIVVAIGIGSLITTIKANRQAQNKKEIINGVAFALETMSRKIRVSPHIQSMAPTAITFADPTILTPPYSYITYQLQSGKIVVSNTGGGLINVTPEGFTVTNFSIIDSGGGGPLNRKFITLRIVGEISSQGQTQTLSLQTSVTPRSF